MRESETPILSAPPGPSTNPPSPRTNPPGPSIPFSPSEVEGSQILGEEPNQNLAQQYLDLAHPMVPGNRCRLLRDGVEAYPAMLEAIEQARHHIRLETFMFIDDQVGELFARVLGEAAERGVRVKVLYDWLGSWHSRSSFFRRLRKRGVDVRPFNPFRFSMRLSRLIRRDHRKLLIVDGKVAFVGGINIAAQWSPQSKGGGWRDDVLEIEGPAVAKLERRFFASWRLQFKKGRGGWRRRAIESPKGTVPLCVLSSRRAIHAAYVRAIRASRRRVMIAAGYFLPDRRILAAIQAATSRGVEVSLVMTAQSDHPAILWAGRSLYERLLAWGVRIYEWQGGVLHSKSAVVDGVWGTVGSFNLERMSLWFNHEVNVFFADPEVGRALEACYGEQFALCKSIDAAKWNRRPLWRRALERLAYFFKRIL